MEAIIQQILSFGNSIAAIIIIILAYFINKWIFNKVKQDKEKGTITRQIITVLIFLIGALIFTISLPIEQSLKGQIISLIGIVISAALALSSTTIIGNALAGLMNSSIKNFNLGNFIKVENNFGRVTKKGLFRVEIQTEDRNLTSLPNIYIALHPLKIVRDSGTIISTTISLGYDIPRTKVEKLLLVAAEEIDLSDPFVYIESLGDFSVVYRISGLLKDTSKYFTSHSLLNASVMDALHKKGIEIVSPNFMNQRQVNEQKFIPPEEKSEEKKDNDKLPEETIFDKAIEADKIDDKVQVLERINKQITELKENLKEGEDKEKTKDRINLLEKRKEALEENINQQKDKLDEHK